LADRIASGGRRGAGPREELIAVANATQARVAGAGQRSEERGVIDCDVHNALPSRAALKPYLPSRWHALYDQQQVAGGVTMGVFAPGRASVFRMDAWPEAGPPGSDLGLLRSQLLDPYRIEKAILHPVLDVMMHLQYGDYGLALAAATNDWMVGEWLDEDDRLFGAITVPIEDGNLAAREIERAAAHRKFAKVTVLVATREPLGHSKYWPVYEAAVANGLPIAAHVAGFSGSLSAAGAPSYQIEFRTNWELPFEAQVVSLVYSGVFDRFPDLRFVLEEGGLAWIPPLLWRLDRTWEAMRDQVPHLAEPPSAIVRRHFAFTTQPLYEPEKPQYLVDLFDELAMDDSILYASDYPHHDFDDPERVLPASLIGQDRRRKLLSTNAERLFRFGD
jgi:predicted TIM-barrel fold metal-dependent hydrolase